MNVFRSTIRQFRWTMAGTLIFMLLMAYGHVLFWPDIKLILGRMIEGAIGNPILKGFVQQVAGAQIDKQFAAYTSVRWCYVLLTLAGSFSGIAAGMVLVAGEEEKGTLTLLISRPVSRTRIILEKFAAAILFVFIAVVPSTMALHWFAKFVGEEIALLQLASSCILFLGPGLLFAGIALWFSTRSPSSVRAGGWAFLCAVVLYVPSVFRDFRAWSPFTYIERGLRRAYFDPIEATAGFLNLWTFGWFALATALLVAASCVRFNRRSW